MRTTNQIMSFHGYFQYEENFEFDNRPHEFIDMESGEKLRLQSNQVREFYTEKLREYKEALKLKCLQYRIDLVETDIRKGFVPILESYLMKRKKMNV